jgi:hypothetical protein
MDVSSPSDLIRSVMQCLKNCDLVMSCVAHQRSTVFNRTVGNRNAVDIAIAFVES